MIKPLFPYYGSKWRDAKRYPAPHNGYVIEPFAGSAGYSLYYEPARVRLLDVDPIIVGVWEYLIRVQASEILALPDLEVGQSVDDLHLPQEARWLIGFWLNRGSAQPKKTKTAYSARTERSQLIWSERARARIASDVHKVDDWVIKQASYDSESYVDATYFVDPPYVDKGRYYRFSDVDYASLGLWCTWCPRAIVCEQAGADWLPSSSSRRSRAARGRPKRSSSSATNLILIGSTHPADREPGRREIMRKLVLIAAAVLSLAIVAPAQAYQNVDVGRAYACNYVFGNAMTNLQSQGFNTNQSRTCFNYGGEDRHGDNDVTYGISWNLGGPPICCDSGGFIMYPSDRFQIRVVGPNSSMAVTAITDWGVAYRRGQG